MELRPAYLALYLFSVFLSAVSQVLLKKSALKKHSSAIAEYLNWQVLLGYTLFVGCTMITTLAYRGIPMNVGPALEATGYIYVTIFGVVIFHERINKKKVAALVLILGGIVLYVI